jgi:hypothetical protein
MREPDDLDLDNAALVAGLERVRRGGDRYMLEPLPAHRVNREVRVNAAGYETGAGVVCRKRRPDLEALGRVNNEFTGRG